MPPSPQTSPPQSTPPHHPGAPRAGAARRRRTPWVVAGGGAVVVAGIVGAGLLLPSVSGAVGGDASTPETLDTVTERPELGAPRDPLSGAELAYALHLATSDASVPADVTSVDGSAEPQVLSVDVATRDVDSTDRVVDVVLYDYTSDRTFLQAVDLGAGTVESSAASGVQPPPSGEEVDHAFGLLLADAAASAGVRAEFAAVTGGDLTSADQLGVTGGSFVPDASTVGAEVCATDRCVEMQLRVPGGGYLDTTSFVVDLSSRSVIEIR